SRPRPALHGAHGERGLAPDRSSRAGDNTAKSWNSRLTTLRTIHNLQLCPMYRQSPLFRALPFTEKVVEAVRALLGDPLILPLDQVFLKPGKTGMGTQWHQDKP